MTAVDKLLFKIFKKLYDFSFEQMNRILGKYDRDGNLGKYL